MGDCPTCPRERRVRTERRYRSVPRQVRYGSPTVRGDMAQYYYPRQRRRLTPLGCDEPECCVDPFVSYQQRYSLPSCVSPCPPPCPCPSPCPDTQCCYCPATTDSGFLHSIRNGFQKIFTGRKRNSSPIYRKKVYNYSTSQLRYIEQHLDLLEDEAYIIETVIKDAFDYDCGINCTELKCSICNIRDRLESIRCDLMSAYDCYDPYRDRCEYDLICSLMDKCNCLESFVNDLCLQMECLDYQLNCYPTPCDINCRKPCCVKQPACKPNCKKPCCYVPVCPKPYLRTNVCEVGCRKPCCVRPIPCEIGCRNGVKPVLCEPGCRKPCCFRPRRWGNRDGLGRSPFPGLCRTSSVVPVGVMLVKL